MDSLIAKGNNIAGTQGYYQILITIIMLFFGITTNICYAGLFIMETPPLVEIEFFDIEKNLTVKEIRNIDYDICKGGYNFTIIEESSKHTWAYDYNIFCDKLSVSLIGFYYCFGSILGALSVQFYIKRIGPKHSIIYNSYIFIIFSYVVIFNKSNLIVLYISIMFFGSSTIAILLLKIALLSEISSSKIRPFLNNIVMTSSSITLIIVYLSFEYNIHYKLLYFFNSLILLCITLTFQLIASDSHRFLLQSNQRIEYLKAILMIYKLNQKSVNGINEKQLKEFILNFKDDKGFKETIYSILGNKYNSILNSDNNENSESDSNCYEVNTTTTSGKIISNKSILVIENINGNQVNLNLSVDTSKEDIIIANSKFISINFVFTFGIINFLSFIFNIGMKEYSYYFHSKLYLFCFIQMFSSIPLGILMNYLGRKGSKIYLVIIFMIIIYIKELDVFEIETVTFLFLLNKLLIHLLYLVNLTHLNETFNSNIRIIVGSWANMLGKFLAALAPFAIEYFYKQLENIMLLIASICLILILNQYETLKKDLL